MGKQQYRKHFVRSRLRWQPSRLAVRALVLSACFSALLVLDGIEVAAQEVSPSGSIGGYEAKFVDVNGIRTRYYDVGSGEPMLLLHGATWGGWANANTWVDNFATLSKHFRVIAMDRIGGGMTDNPEREEDYNVLAMIQHMYDFIQTMELAPVHIVAHSVGGVVLYMAVEHPELVKTMVLVASNHASPAVGESRRAEVLADCPPTDSGPEDAPWLDEWVCRYRALSYDPSHVTEEFTQSYRYIHSQPQSQAAMAKRAAGAGEPFRSTWNEWRNQMHQRIREEGMLQMPILIYWGRNDPNQPLERAMALYDILGEKNPNLSMTIVNKAGHFSYREKAEQFNQTVIKFIESWREMGVIGTPR